MRCPKCGKTCVYTIDEAFVRRDGACQECMLSKAREEGKLPKEGVR